MLKVMLSVGIKAVNATLGVFYMPLALLLKMCRVRVLHANFFAIGHLAMEPDVYLKEQKLSGKKYLTILLPPHTSLHKGPPFKLLVANEFLLKCWGEYFLIIQNFFLYLLFLPLLRSPLLKYDPKHFFATRAAPYYTKQREATEIYKAYNERHEEPGFPSVLLKLKAEDRERGKKILQELGVPSNAWYVCFNCREPGYYSAESHKWSYCRDSSIENTELALREIIDRGGWCIRLGSSQTRPLPKALKKYDRVIDYPHTSKVSDFMDIFLISSCRFFLGTNSGLTGAANVFGVPCVCTNVIPFGMRTLFPNDILIFKLHRFKSTKQIVPFSHCMHSFLTNSISMTDYEELEIELIENTPEEIRDVVREMLNRLDSVSYSLKEEALQKKFQKLFNSFNLHHRAPSRIGTAFLQKYEYLL